MFLFTFREQNFALADTQGKMALNVIVLWQNFGNILPYHSRSLRCDVAATLKMLTQKPCPRQSGTKKKFSPNQPPLARVR